MARRHWIWIFGEIEGLRWVLANRLMAFSSAATKRGLRVARDDRAVLYVTRGAHHNPTRDRSYLAGVVAVTGEVAPADVDIAGTRYVAVVPIQPLVVLPERAGPPVVDLVGRLSFVRRPQSWGAYFRTSPVAVTPDDFAVLEGAVRTAASRG
jgi:hypothetical protein